MIRYRTRALGDIFTDTQSFINAGQALLNEQERPKLIERITVETAYTPKMEFDYPFVSTGQPSKLDPALKLLRPRITVKVRYINNPMVTAPYGEPGESKWPLVKWGAILGGGLLALVFVRGLMPRR